MGQLTGLWLLLWTGGAEAATGAEYADTMLAIPPMAWLLTLIAAGLGGVLSIISKMSKVPTAIDLRPAALSASMIWSLAAGALGFLGSLAIDLVATAIPIVVFACAVIGRPVIDSITGLVRAWIKRKGGDVPPAP